MAGNRSFERLTGEMSGNALLVSEAAVFYFTGFRTSARRPKQIGYTAVWLSEAGAQLICPQTWQMQIDEMKLTAIDGMVPYDSGPGAFEETVLALIKERRPRHLWTEYESLSLPLYMAIRSCDHVPELRDVTKQLWNMRLVKDAWEIDALKRAAKVAADAMEYARGFIKPCMKELDVAAELEYRMRKAGSGGVPFTMKAMTGARSAVVTRVPQDAVIMEGDLFLLDFGAVVDGYSSDWTRTFCIGEPTKEQQELYDFVWEMERCCIGMVKPGCPMSGLTDRMQEMATGHPLGPYIKTHLGHSIGITSHEPPVIEPGVTGKLMENMVITVEPGAYIPGFGGVRIEDEILVTKDGYEILTGLKKEGLKI